MIRRGTKVIAHKVGQRNAFKGTVRKRVGYKRGVYYHVEDRDGRLWHRTDREVTEITPKVTP